MRVIFGMVNGVLVMLVVVVIVATDGVGPVEFTPVTIGLLGLGLASVVAGAVVGRRPLPTGGHLAGAFRSRMFLAIGLVEIGPLNGFVAAFVVDVAWPYLAMLVPAAIAMGRIAPADALIRADEESLRRRGVVASVREELSQPVTPRRL